jgi:maltooligosyltrehalose trehalohydrolase
MNDPVEASRARAARAHGQRTTGSEPAWADSPQPLVLGAIPLREGCCRFTVWAPRAQRVEILLIDPASTLALERGPRGYFSATAAAAPPGSRYFVRLDGEELPDPASRSQPEGVHGPSAVVDARSFRWTDGGWRGVALSELVLYELHVGTYTREGTFDALIPHLDRIRELGVTALELMPVAQFPGARNWGYDGVLPFAPQDTYGGPEGLRRLVDACHARGLAVVLDVVFNHLGPEGNVLARFGPYFTDRYRTPWGPALNFDGPASDEVRRFFVESALHWLEEHHVDGLRLDAIHAIVDRRARTFVEELAAACRARAKELRREFLVIGESDRNDPREVESPEHGGAGLDAVWCDDFHHALHALVTSERAGYYRDFGELDHLARAFRNGFVLAGDYSRHREHSVGRPPDALAPAKLVVSLQNHDQVGNRALGERWSVLAPPEARALGAAAVLLSPFTPLVFMGEEHGETAPFLYFTSHGDPELADAVRRGRREEFAALHRANPSSPDETPDPQEPETFERSRVDHELALSDTGRALRELYRELIRLRREHPAFRDPAHERVQVERFGQRGLRVHRWNGAEHAVVAFNFGPKVLEASVPLPRGCWRCLLCPGELGPSGEDALVPAEMGSDGEVVLTLRPWAFAVLAARLDGERT